MEINVCSENEEKNEKKEKYLYFHKLLTYLGTFLIVLLIFYLFFIIEKYILYIPIYSIINILFIILNVKAKLYIIIISFVSLIMANIFLIHLIILSEIFRSGGIFARFSFYGNFKDFINQQINLAKNAIECLYFPLNESSINILNNSIFPIISFQKAYNNLKMGANITFEIKNYQFRNYLNEIIYDYNKYKEENYNSDETKTNLINALKSYKRALIPYINFSFIDIILKFKYKGTLQILNELLLNSFNKRTLNNINIAKDFNIYIISPEIQNSNLKTLAIFCGQNSFNVEILSFSKDNIKFYLDIKEITLLIWNYKGYGLRAGFPTFNNIDKDVEILKEYINKYYSDYKIIIHGISIGGYASIKLAKILNNKRNVCLIADRTFSDIDLIAEDLIKNGKNIYNFLFPKFLYKTDNVQNYIDIPIGNKIILFDEKDSIITYSQSSLIYNITKKYYNEIILLKISSYKQYTNIMNLFSKNLRDLQAELRRIKNIKEIKSDNTALCLVKNLIRNARTIDKFLMYFLIFGYPFNLHKEINYDKTIFAKNYIGLPEVLRKIYENYKNKFSKNLINLISDLNFLFIKSNLIIPFNDEEIIAFNYNNDNNDFCLQEGFQENIMKYFGYVHRIFCGHNGNIEDNDEQYLKKFLIINEFI